VERAAVLSKEGLILPEYLPSTVLRMETSSGKKSDFLCRTLAEVEWEQIRTVLESTGGNRTQAAKILGISAAILWRKLKDIGIADKDQQSKIV